MMALYHHRLSSTCASRMQPSVVKTVVNIFHVHNARIDQELDIIPNGKRLKHNNRPIYLGVTKTTLLKKLAAMTIYVGKNTFRSNNYNHLLRNKTWTVSWPG